MSWAFQVPVQTNDQGQTTTAEKFEADFDAALESYQNGLLNTDMALTQFVVTEAFTDMALTQFAVTEALALKEAALALMKSGAVGPDGSQYSVYVSGHVAVTEGAIASGSTVGVTVSLSLPAPVPS